MNARFNANFTAGLYPPSVKCTRSGSAWYINTNQQLTSAPADTLRIGIRDFAPKTNLRPGLLREEDAINYCLRSRDLSNATWAKTNATIGSGYSLDGGSSGHLLTPTTLGTDATVLQTVTVPGSALYTFSVYLRSDVNGVVFNVDLTMNNGSTWTTKAINAFGWTRVSMSATTSNPQVGIRLISSVGITARVHFDCAQVEQNTYASSPIVTTSASVTRNRDQVYIDVDQLASNCWFDKDFFTAVVWAETYDLSLVNSSQTLLLVQNAAETGDYLELYLDRASGTRLNAGYGASQFYTFFSVCDSPGQRFGVATSYRSGEQLACLTGRVATSPTTPQAAVLDFSTVDKIYIGNTGSLSHNPFSGYIERIAFFDRACDESELAQLSNI